jgi:hypothetical protein
MALRLGSRSPDDLEIQHEINVTPFIDVILVLLIIFMAAISGVLLKWLVSVVLGGNWHVDMSVVVFGLAAAFQLRVPDASCYVPRRDFCISIITPTAVFSGELVART